MDNNLGVPQWGTCTPLRRHSYSAPPRLVLDGCIAQCSQLSDRLDKFFDKVRADRGHKKSDHNLDSVVHASVDELLDEILDTVVGKPRGKMAPRGQCHQCHRPLHHPDHVGVAPGINKCTLDHFDLCPGGRKSQKDWAGCPDEEETDYEDNPETEQKSTGLVASFHNQTGAEAKKVEQLDPNAIADALAKVASIADQVVLDDSDEDTDDEEERLLQEDIARLKIQVDNENQAKLQAEEKKKKEEKKRLKKERLAWLEKQKAELINQSRAFANKPAQHNARPGIGDKSGSNNLRDKAAELASKQQNKNNQNIHKDLQGLTIAGIRALPGITPAVEDYLVQLQSAIPSLAKTPTARSASGVSFQPTGVFQEQVGQHLAIMVVSRSMTQILCT